MRKSQPVTQHEYQIRDDQNLLSRTDLKGRITYAAPAFVEVSGYSHEELIGAPHSLVRHPDMPEQAFADLWQTIERGEIWSGLVKNRRKNGDYYWVRANVAPIIENGTLMGYSSVRVRPDEDERREAEAVYARLKAGDGRGIRLHRGQVVQSGLRSLAAAHQPAGPEDPPQRHDRPQPAVAGAVRRAEPVRFPPRQRAVAPARPAGRPAGRRHGRAARHHAGRPAEPAHRAAAADAAGRRPDAGHRFAAAAQLPARAARLDDLRHAGGHRQPRRAAAGALAQRAGQA